MFSVFRFSQPDDSNHNREINQRGYNMAAKYSSHKKSLLLEIPEKEFLMNLANLTEFYEKIFAFKKENPSFNYGFLADENIEALQGITNLYTKINDYIPPHELDILKKAAVIKKQKKTSEFTLSEMRIVTDALKIQAIRSTRQNAIADLNQTADGKSVFDQLRNAKQNRNNRAAQNKINEIEIAWKKRSHFANQTSDILNNLASALEQLENDYLKLINDEFLNNNSYAEQGYEYVKNVTQENKNYIRDLTLTALYMIKQEREKLAQAMLERLALVPRDQLKEFTSQSDLLETPIYDDVVSKTISDLTKLGLSPKYKEKFDRLSPTQSTLNGKLIKDFNTFISIYGSSEQKLRLSSLSDTIPLNQSGHSYTYLTDLDISLIVIEPESKKAIEEHPNQEEQKENNIDENDFVLMEHDLEDRSLDESQFEFLSISTVRETFEKEIKEFDLILNSEESTQIEKFISLFNIPSSNIRHFIEQVKQDLKETSLSLDEICKQVYIKMLADSVFPEDKLSHDSFISIATKLAETWEKDVDFETTIIQVAFDHLNKIDKASQEILRQYEANGFFNKENFSNEQDIENKKRTIKDAFINATIKRFIDYPFSIEKAITDEKLNSFIEMHAELFNKSYCKISKEILNSFKLKAKNAIQSHRDWRKNESFWLQETNNQRKITITDNPHLELKWILIDVLDKELVRLHSLPNRNFPLFNPTLEKDKLIDFLQIKIREIANVQNAYDLKNISNAIINNKIINPDRLFNSYSIYYPIKTNVKLFVSEHFENDKRSHTKKK